jgi:hypothetical protein
MTERKHTRRLPGASGYATVARWNINALTAEYHAAHGYVGVKFGDIRNGDATPDADLCLNPAGWRALMTAVLAVMPGADSQPLTRDELLMAANVLERLQAFPALNNRRGEWSADMLRHESQYFEGGARYKATDDDADYPAAEVTV